jgi:cell division protein FtsB
MKLFHLIVTASLTVFMYCALSVIWGTAGNQEYLELVEYQTRLELSLEKLQQTNERLEGELNRLNNDPSRLKEEAHRIGMVDTDQILVKLPANINQDEPTDNQFCIKPASRAFSPALISGIAVSLGIILLLILTLFDLETSLIGSQNTKKRRLYPYQGIRVQTASRE